MTDIMKDSQDTDAIDIIKKENELHKYRISSQYKLMQEKKHLKKVTSSIDLSLNNTAMIDQIKKENDEYFEALRHSKVFINNDFKTLVQHTPKSVTLVAASTGEGKSTISANLTLHSIIQKQKVMVIVNEEKRNDVYNRITALIKGWSYTNHQEFTVEQQKTFVDFVKVLSQRVMVIDNDHNGVAGQTSTIEGIEAIFKQLLHDYRNGGEVYNEIIIDYYQNISMSSEHPHLANWQVQERFGDLIDWFKNVYPAPIVILAQKKPTKEDDEIGFKESIEGRKSIINKVTCAIEVRADRENYRTAWHIKKSRFSEGNGKTVYTGYDKGKYVPYDKDFLEKIEKMRLETTRTSLRME